MSVKLRLLVAITGVESNEIIQVYTVAVSEVTLSPSKKSYLPETVESIYNWSPENRLQLNPTKCKQLVTSFKKSSPS